jgi:hypothetical protein
MTHFSWKYVLARDNNQRMSLGGRNLLFRSATPHRLASTHTHTQNLSVPRANWIAALPTSPFPKLQPVRTSS